MEDQTQEEVQEEGPFAEQSLEASSALVLHSRPVREEVATVTLQVVVAEVTGLMIATGLVDKAFRDTAHLEGRADPQNAYRSCQACLEELVVGIIAVVEVARSE